MTHSLSPPLTSATPRSPRFRKAAWIGLALFGTFLAVVLITPHFIDLGLFKRTYLPLLEESLNRRIDVGEVHLSLVPTPAIRLSQLNVSNSGALPRNTFFSVQQIRLKLRLWPLLRGRLEITELVLDKPIFNLIRQADGSLTDSAIGSQQSGGIVRRDAKKKLATGKSTEATPVPVALPQRLRIQDGQLNIIAAGLAPINIKGIDVRLREFTGAVPFPFRLAFDYPGLNTVSLEGRIHYRGEKALLALIDNHLTVQQLTFPVQGQISNLASLPKIELRLGSDRIDVKAILQILAALGWRPGDLEMSGPMGLSVSLAGPSNSLVTEMRGRFKDVKVHSKRALRGQFSGAVELHWPLGGGWIARRVQGGGKLTAQNGELTNVDLIKKIQRVTGMIGFTKDQRREVTTFRRLETDFTVHGGLADFSRIYLVNPQLEAQGNGTMTLEQPTLDMAFSAMLSSQASARASRPRAAVYFKNSQGRIVVPLKINGPVANPAVNLNAENFAQSKLPPPVEKKLGSFFRELFRDR